MDEGGDRTRAPLEPDVVADEPSPGPTLGGDDAVEPTLAPADPADRWPPRFRLQMAVALCVTTAVQAIRPTVTYRAIELGADPLGIGIVQSAFSFVPMLAAVAVGRWVDQRGEVPFLRLAMAAILAGSVLETIAPDLPALVFSQLVLGLGQILNLVSAQALVANRGRRTERDSRYGVYFTMNSIGQLIGPAAAGFIAGGASGAFLATEIGPTMPFGVLRSPNQWVFAAGCVLAALGLVLSLLIPTAVGTGPHREPDEEPPVALLGGIARVVRRAGMPEAMVVSITVISCVDVLIAYLPAYGEIAGLSVGLVGLLLSVRSGASLVSRVLMTRAVRAFGRGPVLTVSLALAVVGLGAVPLTASAPLLFGLMILAGLGLGIGQPMTISWVAERSPRRERGIALGVRIMGNRGSTLVVPTIMGGIAGAAGIGAIFLVLGAALAGALAIAARTRFDEIAEQAAASSGAG